MVPKQMPVEMEMERGHQLAKYLSCCAASQCADTHICSRRVAKAGAAACAQCGGAGGGSEWAKTFALALCETFECPRAVQREALDLVLSAVAVASTSLHGDENQDDTSGASSDETPAARPCRQAIDTNRGDGSNGGSIVCSSGSAADGASVGEVSAESEGASDSGGDDCLGSSWGSVSSACEAEPTGAAGGYGSNGLGAGVRGRVGFAPDDQDEYDDDDTVLRGRWFPRPTTAATVETGLAPRARPLPRVLSNGAVGAGISNGKCGRPAAVSGSRDCSNAGCGVRDSAATRSVSAPGAVGGAGNARVLGATRTVEKNVMDGRDVVVVESGGEAVTDGNPSSALAADASAGSSSAAAANKRWWGSSYAKAAASAMQQMQRVVLSTDDAGSGGGCTATACVGGIGKVSTDKIDGNVVGNRNAANGSTAGSSDSGAAIDDSASRRLGKEEMWGTEKRERPTAGGGRPLGVSGYLDGDTVGTPLLAPRRQLLRPPQHGRKQQHYADRPQRGRGHEGGKITVPLVEDKREEHPGSTSGGHRSQPTPPVHGQTPLTASSATQPPQPLPSTAAAAGDGAEFVVLVSREATVRELAATVGGFPKAWLEEALGMVVRRQVEGAAYDARARAAVKRAVRLLEGRVSWKQVAITEKELAAMAHDHEGRIVDGDQNKEAPVPGRYWKVGLAAAGGGVLLFLSGGVAAPSVSASLSAVGFAAANTVSYVAPTLGAWLGYTSASAAAAVGSTVTAGAAGTAGSVGAFSAVSGAAGAGVAGYKMTRRTAGVQEFHFLPLHSKWPLDSPESMFEGASEPGLPVFICIPGWHEPGHDPRHTWGGVGYGTPSTQTPPGTPPDEDQNSRDDGDKNATRKETPGPGRDLLNESRDRHRTGGGTAGSGGDGPRGHGGSDVDQRDGLHCSARMFSRRRPSRRSCAAGHRTSWLSSEPQSSSESSPAAPTAPAGASPGIISTPLPTRSSSRSNRGQNSHPPFQQQQQQQQQSEPRPATALPQHRHPSATTSGDSGGTTATVGLATGHSNRPHSMSASFVDLGAVTPTGTTGTRSTSGGSDGGNGSADAVIREVDGRPPFDARGAGNDRRGGGRIGSGDAAGGDGGVERRGGDAGGGYRQDSHATGWGDNTPPHRRRKAGRRTGVGADAGGAGGGGEGLASAAEENGKEDEENAMENSWEALPSHAWWRDFVSGGEEHVLVWERGPLTELHSAMRDLAWKSATRRAVNEAIKRSALAPVIAAAAWPLALLEAASGLDDPWGVVRSRALEAGRLLAAVLLSRPVGSRPVTLLGYSMGAKVVFNCLEALAAAPGERGLGIVENAVMLGTPVGTKRGRWKRARSAVAGRLINGYSSRDWLLALVYRSKSWSVGVAGTSRVEGCGVENVDLSNLVVWHLSYSRILPTVMAMLRLEE